MTARSSRHGALRPTSFVPRSAWLTTAMFAAIVVAVAAVVAVSHTPSRPVADGVRPCTVNVTPGMDAKTAVQSAPEQAVICFAAGQYPITSAISPKAGQVLQGFNGADISGARSVDQWVPAGSAFKAHGYLPSPYSSAGVCEDDVANTCLLAETLSVNGTLLKRVTSVAAVTASSYYADYANNDIYLGYVPATGTALLSSTRTAINSTAPNVTIQDLTFSGFASLPQQGAVVVSGSNWLVQRNEVTDNHGVGIMLARGDNARILNNNVHDNGQLGIGQWRSANSLIQGNTIVGNNTDGFWIADWESGGMKFTYSSATISGNTVADNRGVGIWGDVQDSGVTIKDNNIRNNWADGIRYEISSNATITGNTVVGNSLRLGRGGGTSLYSGAGIDINTSDNVTITGNTVRGNLNGIGLQLRNRGNGPNGPFRLANVLVSGNSVDMSSGSAMTGMVQNVNQPQAMNSNSISFSGNSYVVSSSTAKQFSLAGTSLDFSGWRAAQQDRTGSMDDASAPPASPSPLPSATPSTTAPSSSPSDADPTASSTGSGSAAPSGQSTPPSESPTMSGSSAPTTTQPTQTPAPPSTPSSTFGLSSTGTVVFADTFSRRVPVGWGSTDGHTWSSPRPQLAVDGSQGSVSLVAGDNLTTAVSNLSQRDVVSRLSLSFSGSAGGSGAYFGISSRVVARSGAYRGTLRVLPDGRISALIYRLTSNGEAVIGKEKVIPGLTTASGLISVKFVAIGASPTRLSLTVWPSTRSEPSPQVTAVDSYAPLQQAGSVGVSASLSGRAGTARLRSSVQDFTVWV